MKVLVVKLSSLGDIIHTLPALSDAASALPGVRFDWVVEEAFAEIPTWHAAVDRVIPVALRRWRNRPLRDFTGPEWRAAREQLARETYDVIIDAQGLIKSALVARLARGKRIGLDRRSARESLAALAYQQRIAVPLEMHAVERTRSLFAAALGYSAPEGRANFGLREKFSNDRNNNTATLWFFHGTARMEKTWPVSHWAGLCRLAVQQGYRVVLPSGSALERQRAQAIAAACEAAAADIEVLAPLSLEEVARRLAHAQAVVAVDTGLGHLAAALEVPSVSLYGPTHPALIGTYGRQQLHLQSPLAGAEPAAKCMAAIEPGAVWAMLKAQLPAVTGLTVRV